MTKFYLEQANAVIGGNNSTPLAFGYASNGDLLAIYYSTLDDVYALQGSKFRYSVNNGLTWSNPVQVSTTTDKIVAAVQSTTDSNVFYTLVDVVTGTTHALRGGLLSYNPTTHTLAHWVGVTDFVTQTNYGYLVYSIVNDGTRIHFLYRTDDYAYETDFPVLRGGLVSTWGNAALDHVTNPDFIKTNQNIAWPNARYSLVRNPAGTGILVLATEGHYADYSGTVSFSITEFTIDATTYAEVSSTTIDNAKDFVVAWNNLGYADIVYVSTTGGAYGGNPIDVRYIQRQSASFTTATVSLTTYNGPPVVASHILDAGQYRFVVGIQSSSSLAVWKLVNSWAYAGSITLTAGDYWNLVTNSGFRPPAPAPHMAVSGTALNVMYRYDWQNYVVPGSGGTSISTTDAVVDRLEVNAAPSVLATSPINGAQSFDQVAETIPLVWSFTDTDDAFVQKAREVRIAQNSPGATVYYVTAGGTLTITPTEVITTSLSVNIPPGTLGASTTGYIWQVRASDIHLAYSAWTPWTSFNVSGRPSVTITNPPSDSVATTNRPVITWTYSDPEMSAQSAINLRLYDSSGAMLWETGVVSSDVASGSSGSRQIGYTLANSTPYTVGLLASDGDGIWSNEVKNNFSTSVIYPPAPTIGVAFDANKIATITVTGATASTGQSAPASCDLYRWSPRLAKYVLMSAGLLPTFTATDVAGPSNLTYRYKVVTFGENGSALDTLSSDLSYDDPEWRLLTATSNIVLSVDEMTFEMATSQESLEPLGRDHPIVVSHGTRGVAGQIRATVFPDERYAIRASVELLANSSQVVYLRNPFGEVFAVSLGSIGEAPASGGYATLTIPFTEVADA